MELSGANEARPVCNHSATPPGPASVPPTPIQPATCPSETDGCASGVSVADTPCALLSLCRPAYENSFAPQAVGLLLPPSAGATTRSTDRIARIETMRAKGSPPQRACDCLAAREIGGHAPRFDHSNEA